MNRFLALLLVCSLAYLPAAERTVLCYGDSITFATWKEQQVGDGNRWTDVLPKQVAGIRTVNAGKNGRTTEDVGGLKEALQKTANPDVVILLLGVNDLKGIADGAAAAAATTKRMAILLDTVRTEAPKASILLCAPLAINEQTLTGYWKSKGFGSTTSEALVALETSYKALAAERKIGFVSLLKAVTPSNIPDGVHPNQAGHGEIAAALAAALTPQKSKK